MSQKWQVVWTGQFPNKCSGLWYLYMNGVDVSQYIPYREAPAYTFGTFSRCGFGDNWDEEWSRYDDGDQEGAWVENNKHWIDDIAKKYSIQLEAADYSDIYKAFARQDWRYNECGGCL